VQAIEQRAPNSAKASAFIKEYITTADMEPSKKRFDLSTSGLRKAACQASHSQPHCVIGSNSLAFNMLSSIQAVEVPILLDLRLSFGIGESVDKLVQACTVGMAWLKEKLTLSTPRDGAPTGYLIVEVVR